MIQGVVLMLVYACIGGFVAIRLRLTPIVGYLAAGVLLGPFTPGPVRDADVAHQLAELRVILLKFGVGSHFSVPDLMAVRSIAVPGAIGQSLVAVLLIMVAKPVTTALITLVLRQPLRLVLIVSPALAQIGEFSFIVAVMGREVGNLPESATQLIVGGAIVSIAPNPFLMRAADWFGGRAAKRCPRPSRGWPNAKRPQQQGRAIDVVWCPPRGAMGYAWRDYGSRTATA